MNKEKIYLVWQDGEEEQYFNQYESLEDAVTSEKAPVEVYEAVPKLLGAFKAVAQPVKIKKVKTK